MIPHLSERGDPVKGARYVVYDESDVTKSSETGIAGERYWGWLGI
jgi:hypothetical protein